MKISLLLRSNQLCNWLIRYKIAIFSLALGLLGLYCLFPLATPTIPNGSALPMSKKAVRRARQAQVTRLDSIRQEVLKLPARRQTRDSALIVARAHNRRATHYLYLLSHETTSTTSTEHVARALANYQPGNYSLDSTYFLR